MVLSFLENTIERLFEGILGSNRKKPMYFGTKHLNKLWDKWKKNQERERKFGRLYLQTNNPKLFRKMKKYQRKSSGYRRKYLEQSWAEKRIITSGDDKVVVIEHPQYGSYF